MVANYSSDVTGWCRKPVLVNQSSVCVGLHIALQEYMPPHNCLPHRCAGKNMKLTIFVSNEMILINT